MIVRFHPFEFEVNEVVRVKRAFLLDLLRLCLHLSLTSAVNVEVGTKADNTLDTISAYLKGDSAVHTRSKEVERQV